MSLHSPRFFGVVVIAAILLGFLVMPTFAYRSSIRPLEKIETVKTSQSSSTTIETDLTFTPVATIYLPIIEQNTADNRLRINIELPDGLVYAVGDNVKIKITVTDLAGINEFTWGLFVNTDMPIGIGGLKDCNGAVVCEITYIFTPREPTSYRLGVGALSVDGENIFDTQNFDVQ